MLFNQWQKNLQKNWNLLFSTGIWIGAFAASIIISPDTISNNESSIFPLMSRLSFFIVAVLVGLSFILAAKLNDKKYTYLWAATSILFLILSVWSVSRYDDFVLSLTCDCKKGKVIKGLSFQDKVMIDDTYPNGFTCKEFCDLGNENNNPSPDAIWTEDSINENRKILIYSYLLCFPFIALTIISITQAIYCSQKEKNNTKQNPLPTSTDTMQARNTSELPEELVIPEIPSENLKFDVALSFAGEDRDFVEKVYKELIAHGALVFYDSDEKIAIDLWAKDLIEELDEVYRKRSKYVVIFVSEHYAKKEWTKLERRSALAKAMSEKREYILPARFDDTELPGLLPSIAFVDLRNETPQRFAQKILSKLRSGNK